MDFEIIGPISQIETIAKGAGIRERAYFKNDMAAVDGERGKELPKFDWKLERSS